MRPSPAQITAAIAAAFVLAGCGGSNNSPPSEPPSQPASQASVDPEAPAPALTLSDTCARVKDALRTKEFGPASLWSAAAEDLRQLRDQADSESQDLIGLVLPALDLYANGPAPGADALDAFDALTDASQAYADACQ